MHDWVQRVLELQERDLRIAKLEDQVASVPQEKAKASAALAEAHADVEAAKAAVIDREKAIKHVEIEVESIEARRRDFEAKSTMIKDNDDYRAALIQIDTCCRLVKDLEDQELTLMEELEAAKGALRSQRKAEEATARRVAESTADLDTRLANCTVQLDKLQEERRGLVGEIPKPVRSRYERILASRKRSHADPAVFAPIRDYTCGSCHMNIPPQERMNAIKGQVVSCPQCSALLYSED